MSAVRREGGRQHVIADRTEGILAVPFAILRSRSPYIGFGRVAPAVKALKKEDEPAADYRRAVPGSNPNIDPVRDSRDSVQGASTGRFTPVDYRLHGLLRTKM